MRKHCLLAVVVVCATVLSAQTFRGGIQGTVIDPQGAVVPNADIVVTNPATGLIRSAKSDAQGDYIVTELPIGTYQVTAKKAGFRDQTVKDVRVEISSGSRVDLHLQPPNAAEVVDVSAGAPLVDTAENNLGGALEADQLEDLPVSGRDFTKLLVLVPGSGGDPSGVADSPGSFGLFSINGNRGRSNNYLLDGTDMNDGYRNLPAINQGGVFGTPATILPIDALQELSIINNTEAEFGRNAGATVNIVTKSGTNNIHGSVYEFFRNNALDARNFFNPVGTQQDLFQNNQFGASAGGPIIKDKTFWFAAYEGQRENVGIPTVATVPTQAQINQAIADNGGVVNPVIANLLARNPWPTPNQPPDANGNNFFGSARANNRVDSVIGKIDQHIGPGDLLTGRYYFGDSNQSFPLALVAGGNLPGFNTVTPTNVNIVSVSYTHIFNPNLLMEVRGGYNRFKEDFFPEDQTFNPASIGLNTGTGAQDFGLPQIKVAGFATLGANTSVPRGRIDTNWQFDDNLSYRAGRHEWKFGWEFRRTFVDGFFDSNYRGQLSFPNLDAFIAGTPSLGSQTQGNSSRQTFQNNYSLYLQDSFRALNRLTLNYGLRWEYFGVLGEEQDRFSSLNSSGVLQQMKQLYPHDLNNFAPRLSLAWDVFGNSKTVLRTGWGVYYDAFSQDFFVGQLPFNTANAGPAYNGIGPDPITFSAAPAAVLQNGVPVFAASTFSAQNVFTVAPNLRTPYIQTYNLNIEQQLAKNVALQVGYVGSAGRKLFRFVDLNQANPLTGTVAFPNFGVVNQFQSSASSNYNSLQASVHFREWHRFTSSVNYTWSHSIDNASDGQDFVPNASQPDNSFSPNREKASSNFDMRQHFSWTYDYRVPDFTNGRKQWLGSGWNIGGVLTASAGQPFNVNYLFEGNFNGSGEFFGRPDLVGNPFAGTKGPGAFLNLSAFAVPCSVIDNAGDCGPGTQHFGNLGRNAFVGPGYTDLDFSLSKENKLTEHLKMQLRVDVFNLLNHPNFANPLLPSFATDFLQNGLTVAGNRGLGSGFLPLTATPDVGVGNPFLGGGGPRNIELAVRLSF
jgi:hypothetical protein